MNRNELMAETDTEELWEQNGRVKALIACMEYMKGKGDDLMEMDMALMMLGYEGE